MRRTVLWFLGILVASFVFIGMAQAADKLGYVDLSRTFSEYGKTKEYDKSLSEKETAYNSEREKKVNEVKQLQDKMNLLSDKEKETKKTELTNKIKSLQDLDREKQTDLRKEQDEKMKEILKDIEDAVKAYAQKEGYTMVFNDRVLVYQEKNLEITDKVIEILNKGKK
ncbi:MAG: OmpH family outer membrane protein [Candidatus Omnitrophota bacterium]